MALKVVATPGKHVPKTVVRILDFQTEALIALEDQPPKAVIGVFYALVIRLYAHDPAHDVV